MLTLCSAWTCCKHQIHQHQNVLKLEIDCSIVHVGTLYTHKFYERALILEAYESTLLVKNKLEKTKKKLYPSVLFYVWVYYNNTTQTHCKSNVVPSFVYYRLILQNSFCQTFTPCDLGQPLHPATQVTLTCHLPRDKFCKTSSNQRLWECVRRRNFNTDTLND